MVRVGRDLWGSPSPNPLPKQGHLEQAAQDLFQVGFEYLQRRTYQKYQALKNSKWRHKYPDLL